LRRSNKTPVDDLAPWLFPETVRGEVGLPIVWSELFGNDRPVEVEIGFGKGLFLANASGARPDVNFFGVEIVRKYQLIAATRFLSLERTNVKVASTDGGVLLRDRVASASIQGLHVYFPDPWWKARHKKRRVFTEEFAATGARILRPGGTFYIVTDVEEYFGVMRGIVDAMPKDFVEIPPPAPTAAEHELDYLTNFERKFRKEGRPIYRVSYRRTDA
jgi:tRNA (guanine-N7-)-methyltransferase